MTPLEQRSKAQVEGIVKEFVDEQRKKLKQPPAAVVAVAKAQAIAKEVVENYFKSLHLRPLRPSKAEAADALYEVLVQRFEKELTTDELKHAFSWLNACMIAERLRDYLV